MCVRVIQLQRSQPRHLTSVRSIDAKQETVRSDAYEYALETRSIGRSVIIGCSFAKRGARRSSDDSLENYVGVVSTKWDSVGSTTCATCTEKRKKKGLARWTTKMGMGVKRGSAFSRWRRFGSVEFYFSPDRRLCEFAYVFRSRVTYSSFVQQRSKIGVVLVNEDQLVALS